MKLSLLLAGAVSALSLSSAAFAADLTVMAEPMVYDAPADWTGAYFGVQGGVVGFTGTENDPDDPYDPYYSDFGAIGGSLGLFAGYDFQVGDSFVLGLGGEVNWVSASAEEYDDTDSEITQDWQAAIQARAGVLVTPDLLVYGLVGYSWAGFDASEYWEGDGYDDYDWTGGGVKVGAGIEASLGDGMFVRGEADVTYYDTQTITYLDDPEWEVTPTVVSAKVGLGWKF